MVKKYSSDSATGQVLDKNSILLIGDFDLQDGYATLDYENKNYFWLPFGSEFPFYYLDQAVNSSVSSGKFIFDNTILASEDIDITYWCSCPGSTDGPGNCDSNFTGNQIRCVEEFGSCSKGCQGSIVIHGVSTGGGLLVQVDQGKERIVHNLMTAK